MRAVRKLTKNLLSIGSHKGLSIPKDDSVLIERNVAKSFQEAVNERIMNDIPKVLGSFLIMFIYVSISLGKLDCFENRVMYCVIKENKQYI